MSASLQAARNAGLVTKVRTLRPLSGVMEAIHVGGQGEEEEEDPDVSDFGDAMEEVIVEEPEADAATARLKKELRGAGMKEDEIENFLLESGFTTIAECNDVEVDDLMECLMEMGVKKLKSKAISRRLKAVAKSAADGDGGASAPAPAPAVVSLASASAAQRAAAASHRRKASAVTCTRTCTAADLPPHAQQFAELEGIKWLPQREFRRLANAIEWDDVATCSEMFELHAIKTNDCIIHSEGAGRQMGAFGLGANWIGYTAGHHACNNGSVNVLKWFVAIPDVHLESRCRDGKTMVDYAEETEEFHCEHIVKKALGLPSRYKVEQRKMSRRRAGRMASVAAGQPIPQQL